MAWNRQTRCFRQYRSIFLKNKTMKANEFRINNLVYYNGNNNEIGVITSIQTTVLKQCYIYLNNRINNVLDLDLIKQIPLTEEWLIKLGFEEDKNQSFYFYKHNYYDIYIRIFKGGAISFLMVNDYIELKSVHQLQNLYFALTNKELKYEKKN